MHAMHAAGFAHWCRALHALPAVQAAAEAHANCDEPSQSPPTASQSAAPISIFNGTIELIKLIELCVVSVSASPAYAAKRAGRLAPKNDAYL